MNSIFIIPAYVKSNEEKDYNLLERTIKNLTPFFNYKIIVVFQGCHKASHTLSTCFSKEDRVDILYYEKKIGKWGAVKEGINRTKAKYGQLHWPCVILDADDSYYPEDVYSLVLKLEQTNGHYVIGEREEIILPTEGMNNDERLFIELFFNSLSLLRLKRCLKGFYPYDIQTGVQVLSWERICMLDLEYFPDTYGGELELFYQNVVNAVIPESRAVRIKSVSMSSFRLQEITEGLMSLRVFKDLHKNEFKEALKLCLKIYNNRISDESRFRVYIENYINVELIKYIDGRI